LIGLFCEWLPDCKAWLMLIRRQNDLLDPWKQAVLKQFSQPVIRFRFQAAKAYQ